MERSAIGRPSETVEIRGLRDRRDVYRTSGTPELLPRNRIVIGMNIGCNDALADKRQVDDALEARIVAMTDSLTARVAAVEMQHD